MIKQINFQESDWDTLQNLTTAYFTELGYRNDSFHNGMLFGNKAYCMMIDEEPCGFFSLGDSWENGKMLCGFYVKPDKRRYSAEILRKVLEEHDAQAALVASNDAHFVSLAFEKMHELQTSFDMQAYNFTYGEPSRPAEYGMECIEKVQPEHYAVMNELTEGQWEGCYGDPDYTFYALTKDGVTLGFGAIGKMQYNTQNVDIGNYTVPRYRQQGVGRSMLIHLSTIAIQQGYIPKAGCWYGNQESILTLKSSGYLPENRIFYVRFRQSS